MDRPDRALIGFACAYTPLPLIAAAGFAPYRVSPLTDAPDRGGRLPASDILSLTSKTVLLYPSVYVSRTRS
jgi:hypothetical protein